MVQKINTLEEAIEMIGELENTTSRQSGEIRQLSQQNTTLRELAENLMREARRAVDWAKHAYRVDHNGYIWVYDVDAKEYHRTEMRVHTPEVPDGSIGTDKLVDKAVTNEKMDEGAVEWEKLSKDLKTIILSGGGSAIPLSNDWGDSEVLGISQKKLTEEHNSVSGKLAELNNKINFEAEARIANDDTLRQRVEDAETALPEKVDKVEGKGLSMNDYDNAEKQKLADVVEQLVGGGDVDLRISGAVAAERQRAMDVEATKAEKSTTYTKAEVNSLITTPNQQYVTVETYSALPATGAADTIYRVGNWDGSQFNAGVYSEYAWDGSAYVFLDKKEIGIDDEPTLGSNNLVKSGGVHRTAVSYSLLNVNHVHTEDGVEYNDDVYTLEEAIAAIPQNYVRGGLSIIFKKYRSGEAPIIARYIYDSYAVSRFNDTSYWYSLESRIDAVMNVLSGYIININERFGTWTSEYTFDEAIALVPQSERTVVRGVVYRSSEGDSIRASIVIAFFNGKAITRWNERDYWTIFDKEEIDAAIGALFNSVNDIYNKLPYNFGDNVDLSSYWQDGKRINQGGTISDSSTLTNKATSKIAIADIIDRNKQWYVAGYPMGGTLSVMVAYYDTNESFISFQYNDGNHTLNSGLLNIPDNAEYIAFANMFGYGNFTLCEATPNSVNEYVEGKLITKLDANHGVEHSGKYLQVLYDGSVGYGDGSSPEAGSINVIDQQTIFVGNNIRGAATLGQGWSGNDQNGYTHTPGSTEPLVFAVPVTENRNYIVKISMDSVRENAIMVKMGNSFEIDPYNGTTNMTVGFKSDGVETLTITPESSFGGTITNIEVLQVVDESSAADSIQLYVYNVGTSSFTNLTGFWNVAIGNPTAMCNNVNATRSIAIGRDALRQLVSGSRNIGIGTFALTALRNGKGNIAIGADAGYDLQYGDDNIGIGRASLGNSNSSNNICIGLAAGGALAGDGSVCIGVLSGFYSSQGCVYIGEHAGYSFRGTNNIAIGCNAGYVGAPRNGYRNICIGLSTSYQEGVSQSTAIGFHASATKSNQNVIGSTDSVETKVYGDLVVHGTDGIDRKIVFNQDGTVSWESVS